MDSDDRRYAILEALLDLFVPPDDFPGAGEAAVGSYVGRRLTGDLAPDLPRIHTALDGFDAEARARYDREFLELDVAERNALLEAIERGDAEASWTENPTWAFELFRNLAAEGFYADPGNGGNLGAVSWKMLGYPEDPVPKHPLSILRPPPPPEREAYDVIVVGAGAAGGIVAGVLGEAGKHVLVLERGYDVEEQDYRRDHLRNQRYTALGHNTGPDLEGHPRVVQDADGSTRVVQPHHDGYSNNAMVVGGGALVFGAMAFRYQPRDFRMATEYGVPAGSSLADWPIRYDDLEPYYDRAEWEVGVSGLGGADPNAGPRRRGYPMPPVAGHPGRALLDRGAERLGFSTFPLPLFINSVPRLGRPECARSNACVGFPCPSNAKSGSHNTLLPRGLRTGNVRLVPRAFALSVDTDERGHVTGVTYVVEHGSTLERVRARAKIVVLSAGAIESARLLLASGNRLEPHGIGNAHDWVGRNLQGHVYVSATGLMSETVEAGEGPGPTRVTSRYSHGNPGIIGGGILHDEFVLLPILFYKRHLPPDVKRWGLENKRFVRDAYRRTLLVHGPIQETPSPTARVTLDPAVRDRFGAPVARLSGSVHPESVRSAEFLRQRAVEWLEASGAERVWSTPIRPGHFLTAGQHQAGTCRMGADPRESVTDAWGRVHGHDNLYVVDASLHVTNGGMNPSLTIMALAFRSAEHIARQT